MGPPLNKLNAGQTLDLAGSFAFQVLRHIAVAPLSSNHRGEGKSFSCSSCYSPEEPKHGAISLLSPRNVISSARASMLTALLGVTMSAAPEATLSGVLKRWPTSSVTPIHGAWSHSRLRRIHIPSSFLQAGVPFWRIFSDHSMGSVAEAAPCGMFPGGNVDLLASWSCICGEYA
jgi:hypothetical protein